MTTARNVEATSAARRELSVPPRWTLLLRRREILVTAVIVIVVAASTAAHPYFWSSGNLAFIFADSVVITFLALLEMTRLHLTRLVQTEPLAPLYVETRTDQADPAAGEDEDPETLPSKDPEP